MGIFRKFKKSPRPKADLMDDFELYDEPLVKESSNVIRLLPTIVLFEDEDLLITTNPSDFEQMVGERVSLNPHLNDDKRLLETVLKAVERGLRVIDLVQVYYKVEERHFRPFIIKLFLEAGKCVIFDKKAGKPVEEITKETRMWILDLCQGQGEPSIIIRINFFLKYLIG
jgi:hypothetical protein